MAQAKAGAGVAQTGLVWGGGVGGRSYVIATAHESWGLLLAGGGLVLAKTAAERAKGGRGGKGLGPPQPPTFPRTRLPAGC